MLFNIKIRQLRAYYTLMQTRNVTRAGELLSLSQPTISRQLSLLEDAVGFSLFDRKSGGLMVPTEDGERFFREIEGTLLGMEELPNIAVGIRTHRSERLTIVVTTALLHSDILVSAMADFCQLNPEVQLRVEWSHRKHVEAIVVGRQADIGLAALPISHPSLQIERILSTSAVVAVHRDHELATQSSIGPDDIPHDRLILDRGRPVIPHVRRFSDWPKSIPVQFDVDQVQLALKLVAMGRGVTICDPLIASAFPDARLIILPWRPKIDLQYGYFVTADREKSGNLKQLISCIEAAARDWMAAAALESVAH